MSAKQSKPTARPTRAAEMNQKGKHTERDRLLKQTPLLVRFSDEEIERFKGDLIKANVGVQMVIFFDERAEEARKMRGQSINNALTTKESPTNGEKQSNNGDNEV